MVTNTQIEIKAAAKIYLSMGGCSGNEAKETQETQETEEERIHRVLYEKANAFLVAMPDGAATVNETNFDAVKAEVDRREQLSPLILTIKDLNGSNEETTAKRGGGG